MIKSLFFILSVTLVFSCSKDAKTPEGLIEMVALDMTTKKLDKEYFQKYTTGKLLEKIEELNEEELKKYSNLSHVQKPKVEVLRKNCSQQRCSLTYIIRYNVVQNEKVDFKTEVKKIATVIKEDEKWKVEEVTNLKTYHEATQPINALEEEPATKPENI
ncbi:MAG: hypothetical protein CME62_16815 [Halobacteriovoraceae bacterium]|nr:hypothetical protein [Halobacteriovoraceae bacterium]|tara:strand:- start:7268 stop:7744 length:477 start_codon:yes stop_codon:yes gene_type:complete